MYNNPRLLLLTFSRPNFICEKASPVSPNRQQQSKMITCANCHTPNESDAQYCDDCGATMTPVAPTQTSATEPNRISHADDLRDSNTGGRTMPFALVSSASPVTSGSNTASLATAVSPAPHTEVVSPVNENGSSPENGASAVAQTPAAVASLAPKPMNEAANDRQASVAFERQPSAFNQPHAKLVIERGRSAGKGFLINETEAHIGRWDADGGIFPDVDLDADDPEAKVSRRHARIILRADGYYIEDLGSTNGTFINRGRRLLPGALQPLRDGDEIIVGKTFLRLQIIK